MNKKQLKASFGTMLLGVLSPLAMVMPASAATRNWSGYMESFNTGASQVDNWFDAVPLADDSVVFSTAGNGQIVDLDDLIHTLNISTPSTVELTDILFNGAWSGESEKSYTLTALDNIILLSGDIEAIMTGNGGNHSIEASVRLMADSTFRTTGPNTLAVGDTGTLLDLGANDLTLNSEQGTITLMGAVTGTGNIVKSGAGKVKLMLTPDETDGYDGGLTISSGETSVDDDLGLNITLTGGTLKGTGTVGNIAMSAGSIAPGSSPGVINTGNLTYTGGSFDVEIGGKAAGEFDQTNVTGTVDLGSATELNVSLVNGFAPAVNDSFVIINNDGSDAITGTFEGLADGDKFTLGSYTYQINYDAGDGNDVVLLVTGTPSAPDTGVGMLLSSPFATLGIALLLAGSIAGYRYYDLKKARN